MSSSYINQIDAAIAAVQPSSGQNISVVPNPTGGLVVETTPSLTVTGTVSAGRIITGNSGLLVASQTPATSSVSSPAPTVTISGNYWNGSASVADAWTLTSSYINSGESNPPGTNDSSVITLNYTGGFEATGFFIINAFQTNIHSECVMASASASNMFIGGNNYDGASGTFTSVANAVGTLTTYTGPPNTGIPPAGTYVNIAGFTNSANNGRFIVEGSTNGVSSTITVYNSSGAAESHAATWITDLSNESGRFAILGTGTGTYSITGTAGTFSSNTVGANSDVNPNAVNLVLSMQGNATDSAFFHIINNGATGNHGLEMGTVIDGTGANPVFLNIGEFQGTPCVNIPKQPLIMGSVGTAATSSLEQPSPVIQFTGNYWTGSASAQDIWTLQDFLYLGYSYSLTAAADFGGGRAIYTVAASQANPLPPIGSTVRITGFTNISNNGTFTVIDNRTGSFVVNNPSGVSETHAGTATTTIIPTPTSSMVLGHSGATNAQVLLPTGSGSVPQLSFVGDPSTGLKYIGSSQLEISAGSETFGFSSQGGLYVGSGSLSFGSEAETISGTLDPVYVYALSSVANAVGPDTTYTGTFSTPFPTGSLVSISGFVNTGNNVTFASVVSCNSTTLVVVNANGIAETHAGLAASNNPCVYIGGGGSTPNNFTATLGLPKVAYDPPTAGVFTSSQAGRIWFNTTNPNIRYWDGSTTQTVTQTIASGQTALGTTLIGSGAASSILSIAATGVLSTDNVATDFASDPSGVTGYAPSASGMLTIIKFCTPGFVNFYQYNNTGSGITPGAININWRVMR